ncbi:GGDEF domain-containing protein [Hydrogenobacter sp. T-2]|uniref:GGDEF domain-containing protein n=1 Tax=Pampinifervens diazotrophicum TaxID=1632018 RepID=UPI002B25BDA8|nr:GGDEF domain-containing protein [Hydrogenobacter sp. T-2]WPM32159.1 GGDEF domain-containing protein [Hydrogenobacter sp. T-2]
MDKCKLYRKITRGLPLNDDEVKLLGEIIREELKFLIRNNILPTPRNYERWFLVFCHLIEKGKLPPDAELVEIYHTIYNGEKISDVKFDVELTLEVLSKLIEEFHRLIREHKEYADKKEEELSNIEKKAIEGELTPLILELLIHIRDIKAQNERFLKRIEEQQHMIEELKERLQQAETEANIDYLTNTFNRRSFERALREAFEEYKKRQAIFSLVLIDLDGFKRVNDLYGHSAGDLVLRRVAQLLRQSLRAKDILARWGGDEFAVLMSGTRKEQAIAVAERLKKAVEDLEIVVEGEKVSLSFSYGVVESEDRFSSLEEMIKEVDYLMYQRKKSKNS